MATKRVTKLSFTTEDGQTHELAPGDAFYRVGVNGPPGTTHRNDHFTHELRWTTPMPELGEG